MTADATAGTRTGWGGAPYARALRSPSSALWLRWDDGTLHPLPVSRWCSAPDSADWSLLARCGGGPVLDVGCGPGRLLTALQERGVPTLGIDADHSAVRSAGARGGTVLHRSVFDALPGEGRWPAVLLADGNIGIGGDPASLLTRLTRVLVRKGRLLVEVDPVDCLRRGTACLVDAQGARGETFHWARVGETATLSWARQAGLRGTDEWSHSGRRFLVLCR